MEHIIQFDKTTMTVDIGDENLLGLLHANEVEINLMGEEEVKRFLENPIKSPKLRDVVKANEKIAIVTSDITRPMPSSTVLPYVLDELRLAGVKDGDITIVFALGNHRKHTEEEKKYLVGEEIYNKIKCIDSDKEDYVHFGYTKNKTPIDIFRAVAEADRRICLGNIEYHYFAGYSGGAKAIMPGVSTSAAIQANHSRMVDDNAYAGNINTNPVRIDIEDTIEEMPIDFIVNVVLNEKKEIIKSVAGHYIHAHREGCKFLDNLYKIPLKEKADIVIVSSGGYPKDLNLYQAQKSLDNAKHAVKEGGIIILIASCKEGLGEKVFEDWMKESKSPEDLIERVKNKFELGGHKAAAIAKVIQKSKVFLVSDLEEELVRSIYMEPFCDLQSAYTKSLELMGDNATVILIPQGGSILPYF